MKSKDNKPRHAGYIANVITVVASLVPEIKT